MTFQIILADDARGTRTIEGATKIAAMTALINLLDDRDAPAVFEALRTGEVAAVGATYPHKIWREADEEAFWFSVCTLAEGGSQDWRFADDEGEE